VRDPARAFGRAALDARLLGPEVRHGLLGWAVPMAVTFLAALLRVWNLDEPHQLTFDETYYVKDAYSLLQSGYERQWPEEANETFLAGNPAPLDEPAYVVHPPLGKWLIALGMLAFGSESGLGWRAGPALFGTLSVLLVALAAQRLFSSVVLGGIAGLLVAVDGHHLVLSRTALLDVFIMFFIVASFYALLRDREHGRRRLAAALAAAAGPGGGPPAPGALLYGPWLVWRPWRLAAAATLGCAVGVKWSALAFVAVFGLMTVLWDVSARRQAGIRHWLTAGVLRDGIPAFFTIVPGAALVYLATWAGWLTTAGGYDRQWAAQNPGGIWSWVPDPLRSLAEYHRSAYSFHQGLDSDHDWESSPYTWLFAGRPVVFYRVGSEQGDPGCAATTCTATISDLPNPVFWWSAILALLVVLLFWVGRRDWRAGAVLSGVLAGYAPWFAYPDRTMYFFYTLAFQPFLAMAVAYVLGLVLGGHGVPAADRTRRVAAVCTYLALCLVVSAFFWPVWTGEVLPNAEVRLRLWMPSWG
jgi:dolichyl-phosphate-mannose-protein mannosyltransferase